MSEAESTISIVETNKCQDERSGSGPPNEHAGKVRMQRPAQMAGAGASSKAPARKGTGPRTKLGKQRSRYNALKHGVFSRVLLLRQESRTEYQSLVAGLLAACQPQGALEESLVENLAVLTWRKRRLLEAERAEIAKVAECAASDWSISRRAQRDEVVDRDMGYTAGGMLHGCSNPYVLDECISLLKGMQWSLEHNGFCRENDYTILKKIYGSSLADGAPFGFFTAYATLSEEAEDSSSKSVDETNSVCEEKRTEALELVAAEIQKLLSWRKYVFDLEMRRTKYVQQAAVVPSQEVLERLLRYEASLNREFDRTLRQLERLQRMRLGQPVPPSIQVELSA